MSGTRTLPDTGLQAALSESPRSGDPRPTGPMPESVTLNLVLPGELGEPQQLLAELRKRAAAVEAATAAERPNDPCPCLLTAAAPGGRQAGSASWPRAGRFERIPHDRPLAPDGASAASTSWLTVSIVHSLAPRRHDQVRDWAARNALRCLDSAPYGA
jgi:hypothetical protein